MGARAENLRQARAELDGLGLEAWTLAVDTRATRRLGQTRYASRTIGLSAWLIDANGWDVVRDTLLHEAAHALTGPGHGHDSVWKRQARAIGANPNRMSDGQEAGMPVGSVRITCPVHGLIGTRARMPRGAASELRRYRHTGCREVVRFERSTR